MSFDTPFSRVRWTAFFEGISFLLLLFIAMPLKYMAGQPLAVSIVGALHGFLFVALGLVTVWCVSQEGKSLGWAFKIFIASIIPFGTFALDKSLKADDLRYREEMSQSKGASR